MHFPVPGKVSRPEVHQSCGLAGQLTRAEGHDFYQRLSMVKWLDIPESDLDEMCIEFELGTGGGQTRWKR